MSSKDSLCLPPHLAIEFIDSMPICFSYWNDKFEAIYCNQAYIDLFDLKNTDEYVLNYLDFIPPFQPCGTPSVELAHTHIETTLKDGKCTFNWTHQKLNGELVPTEITLVRTMQDGKAFLASYVRDMREIIAREDIIKADKRHKQFLLDTMPLATNTWSEDMQLLECSKEAVRMFGLQDEQDFIENFTHLSPEYQPDGEKSSKKISQNLQQVFDVGYSRLNWIHQNKNGELIPCDVTLVRGEHNGKPAVVAYLLDLRDNYENISQLHKAEQYTKILLDACPLGTLIWDKEFKLIGSNKAISLMFGLEEDYEFIDHFINLIPEYQPDGVKSFDRMHATLQDGLLNGSASTYWVGQDLNQKPIPTEVIVVRVEHNGEEMMAGYVKDLREIEESNQMARAAEEFTQAMLDGVPLAISILDATFKRIDCNEAIVKLFGFESKEDFLHSGHKGMPEFQPDGTSSYELSRISLVNAWENGEYIVEAVGRHLNGELIPVESKLLRTNVHGKDIIINYMRDLRETKAHIKKIQEAETRIRTIIDSSPLCVNLFDPNGALIECNEAGAKLFGFKTPQEFMNNFHKLFPEFQPDGKRSEDMIKDALQQAMEKGHFRIETIAKTIYGEIVPCDVILKSTVINDEKSIISYVRDLREINAALDKAHTATQAAEQSAKAKSEFLANMSHEIRTPMNGILGLLHILSHTELNASQQDYLDKAVLSANNLLRIINDILDFSKIEAGKLEIEEIPFTLHEICSEIQSLFMPQIKEKLLACLMDEGTHATITILGDPIRLKQVLINLIGNAIKFTHHGSVSLNIEANDNTAGEMLYRFIISDTGIGLTTEQIDSLFSAFTQADTSVTRMYGGTGLGLTISKRIVEMMRGEIWVESTIGKGSTFIFTARFKLPEAVEASMPELPFSDLPHEQTNTNAHILLVEDNEINQIIAEQLLTSVGYTVDIAANGQEALDMLDKNEYNLVLMDIQMPVMDGLTASTKIREQSKYKHLPVIAMSAHAMVGDKEISLKHGMNDHITKPISPKLLYNTLNYWLNSRHEKTR